MTGAISKFNGHVFTFDFNDRKTACLKSFYQESEISDDNLNCEFGNWPAKYRENFQVIFTTNDGSKNR